MNISPETSVGISFTKDEREILEKAMRILEDTSSKLWREDINDLACIIDDGAVIISDLLNGYY